MSKKNRTSKNPSNPLPLPSRVSVVIDDKSGEAHTVEARTLALAHSLGIEDARRVAKCDLSVATDTLKGMLCNASQSYQNMKLDTARCSAERTLQVNHEFRSARVQSKRLDRIEAERQENEARTPSQDTPVAHTPSVSDLLTALGFTCVDGAWVPKSADTATETDTATDTATAQG